MTTAAPRRPAVRLAPSCRAGVATAGCRRDTAAWGRGSPREPSMPGNGNIQALTGRHPAPGEVCNRRMAPGWQRSGLPQLLRLMEKPWLFDQPRNCAAISLRQIVREGAPVLLVTHDEDDHGWQFLDGSESPNEGEAVIVCMSHAVDSDPTLYELADLPPGWRAWRPSVSEPWVREALPSEEGV